MNPFITGSRAYGSPTYDSDVDLVVLVDDETLRILRERADSDDREKLKNDSDAGPTGGHGRSSSLRFGKLNLLCVTDPVAYAVWLKGTRILKNSRPVTRDVAVAYFDKLRQTHGLLEETPKLDDTLRLTSMGGFSVGDAVSYAAAGGFERVHGLITEFDHERERALVSYRGKDTWKKVSRLTKEKGLPGYKSRKRGETDGFDVDTLSDLT